MRRDVVRRVRWGNVALACAILTALVGVVVWPLVTSAPPALPPDTSRPLVAGGASPPEVGDEPRPRDDEGERPTKERARRDGDARRRRGGGGERRRRGGGGERRRRADEKRAVDRERRRRGRERKERRARSRREDEPPPPAVAPPVRPAVPTAPSQEFGFERAPG